jgi:hypothetical protein
MTLEKQRAAYLTNGDADPNAPSRVFFLFPKDEAIPAS